MSQDVSGQKCPKYLGHINCFQEMAIKLLTCCFCYCKLGVRESCPLIAGFLSKNKLFTKKINWKWPQEYFIFIMILHASVQAPDPGSMRKLFLRVVPDSNYHRAPSFFWRVCSISTHIQVRLGFPRISTVNDKTYFLPCLLHVQMGCKLSFYVPDPC